MAMRSLVATLSVLALLAPGLAGADAGPGPGEGLLWGPDGRLTNATGDDDLPALAVGPDGDSHLLWARGDRIYYARAGPSGGPAAPEKEVATGSVPLRPDGQGAERAGVDENGDFHFIWTEGGSPWYRRLEGAEGRAIAPVALDPQGKGHSSAGLAVARGGRPYFCFLTGNGTAEMAYLDGSLVLRPGFEVSACAASVTIALDPWDRPHLLWSCPANGTMGLCAFGTEGELLLPPRYFPPAVAVTEDTPLPAMAFTPDGVLHLLQAGAGAGRRELFYTRLGVDGSLLGPHLRVETQAGDAGDLCSDGRDNVFLAWGNDFDADLYYAIARPGDGPVSPVRLTDALDRDRDPRIAPDPQGGLRVAWVSGRDGNDEIYWKQALIARVELRLPDAGAARLSGAMANATRTANLTMRNAGAGPDVYNLSLEADLRGMEGGLGEGYTGPGWKVWLEGDWSAAQLGPGDVARPGLAVRAPGAGAPGEFICVTARAVSALEPLVQDELSFRVHFTADRGLEVLVDGSARTSRDG
ncbi:MAG: hypothetical protein FJ149_12875, partial [Euryarchaeota archaeon]|nr:hypothetical protein [Euryarchaeota archaeon]